MKYMNGSIEGCSTIFWQDAMNKPATGLSLTVRIAAKTERKPGEHLQRGQQAKTISFLIAKGAPGYNDFKAMPVGCKFESSLTSATQDAESGRYTLNFDEVVPYMGDDFSYEAPEIDIVRKKARKFFSEDEIKALE